MVHCATTDKEKRFLHCYEEELAPYLNDVEDKQLAEALQYGVAYFHEALSKSDKWVVEKLFLSVAIKPEAAYLQSSDMRMRHPICGSFLIHLKPRKSHHVHHYVSNPLM